MEVRTQESVAGLYRAPVLEYGTRSPLVVSPVDPPQTIISCPVHTPVWPMRGGATLVVAVAVQVSVTGLYRPPVPSKARLFVAPPQTIISEPVQTAV